MITSCITCGMPLTKKEDVGLINSEGSYCRYCVNADGTAKNAEQIFHGGVSFFMHAVPGISLKLAERVTRRNMKSLPYWRTRNEKCLEGPEATDKEYEDAMKKVGEE